MFPECWMHASHSPVLHSKCSFSPCWPLPLPHFLLLLMTRGDAKIHNLNVQTATNIMLSLSLGYQSNKLPWQQHPDVFEHFINMAPRFCLPLLKQIGMSIFKVLQHFVLLSSGTACWVSLFFSPFCDEWVMWNICNFCFWWVEAWEKLRTYLLHTATF